MGSTIQRHPHNFASAQRFLEHHPRFIASGNVVVHLAAVLIDSTEALQVPYVHFKICVNDLIVGALNLRLTKHRRIVQFFGHVGFEVVSQYRGRGLAQKACEIIAPVACALGCRKLIITCHPDNHASRKTIEYLGSRFIMYKSFDSYGPDYAPERLVYCWNLDNEWSNNAC